MRPLKSPRDNDISRRKLLGVSLLFGTGLMTSCSELPTFRYRLVVEAYTPEGLRTGSGVIEVMTSKGIAFPGPEAGQLSSRMRGEAVIVDLGSRGSVFALLSRPDDGLYAASLPFKALWPASPDKAFTTAAIRHNITSMISTQGAVTLQIDNYPMLVRFSDLSDPNSVEIVNARSPVYARQSDILIRRVSVEITDDAITTGIEKRLSWLPRYRNRHLDGSPARIESANSSNIASHLSLGSFSTEL